MTKQEYISQALDQLERRSHVTVYLLGIAATVGLAGLDFVVFPEHWKTFLVYRAIAATLIALSMLPIWFCAPMRWITYLIPTFTAGGMLAVMTHATGGVRSVYYEGFYVLGALLAGLHFVNWAYTAVNTFLVLFFAIAPPLLLGQDEGERLLVAHTTLLTATMLTVAYLRLQTNRLLRSNLQHEYDRLTQNERLEATVKEKTGELLKLQAEVLQNQKMEAIGTLASGIAHDIRNTVGVILTHLDLIKETGNVGKADESIQAIGTAITDVQHTVEGLLGYVRKDGGKIATDINDLITEMVLLVRKKAEERGIRLSVELAPKLPSREQGWGCIWSIVS